MVELFKLPPPYLPIVHFCPINVIYIRWLTMDSFILTKSNKIRYNQKKKGSICRFHQSNTCPEDTQRPIVPEIERPQVIFFLLYRCREQWIALFCIRVDTSSVCGAVDACRNRVACDFSIKFRHWACVAAWPIDYDGILTWVVGREWCCVLVSLL